MPDLLDPSGVVVALFDTVLHSVWLLPVLVLLIALDGPFPVLPSETLLAAAATAAFGVHDTAGIVGLFVAAVVGSLLGDLFVYGLGRTSSRLVRGAGEAQDGLAGWVRKNLFRRPVLALVGARMVPGGRLVSTAASGLVRLPLRGFLPASAVSSSVWGVYMLLVGLVLGPVTKGNPLLCLLAGIVMAIVTAGGFELGRRVWRLVRRRRDAARMGAAAAPAGQEEAEPLGVRTAAAREAAAVISD